MFRFAKLAHPGYKFKLPRRKGGARTADSECGYKLGSGRPPLHTRFKKGQSGNARGRRTKSLPASLADALNETVVVTIDGRRRKITKREAILAQMVDKLASADLRATKMLIGLMKDVEHKAGAAAPPPEPRPACRCGQGVVQQFEDGCSRQILQERGSVAPKIPD